MVLCVVGPFVRKGFVSMGCVVFAMGSVLGLYGSQRNYLVAFVTHGRMNFWTGVEIASGCVALAGLIILLLGIRRT